MDEIPTPAIPEEQSQSMEQNVPGDAKTESAVVENSIALSVSAAQDAKVENSAAIAFVAGNDLHLTNSGGSTLVAGNNMNIQNGGGAMMVVGNDAQVEGSTIGILFPGGDVNLYGDSKVLMTTQQALALGAGLGVVFALLTAFLRRLRS
jgi:hypothetical protein